MLAAAAWCLLLLLHTEQGRCKRGTEKRGTTENAVVENAGLENMGTACVTVYGLREMPFQKLLLAFEDMVI